MATNNFTKDDFVRLVTLMEEIDDLAIAAYEEIETNFPQVLMGHPSICYFDDIYVYYDDMDSVEIAYICDDEGNAETHYIRFNTDDFLADPIKTAREYGQRIYDQKAKVKQETQEDKDRKEYERLKAKYNW